MRWGVLAVVCFLCASAPALAAFPETPPNDPFWNASPLPNAINEHWDLASPEAGFDRGISADRAWQTTTGRGVVLADIDTGVPFEHEDLKGQWYENPGESGAKRANGKDDDRNGYVDDWHGWDFFTFDNHPEDDTGFEHGALVAGTLAAAADNGLGVVGTAPGARILPVRHHDTFLVHPDRIAESIVYAVDARADVISMSLGSVGNSLAARRAVEYAERKGVVVVEAMGNEFHYHRHYPLIYDQVLRVGGVLYDTAGQSSRLTAATRFDVRAAYSDYGPHIDVVAPTHTPSTEYPSGYSYEFGGTSAATPHAAAVAGLVVARGKDLGLKLKPGEVRQIVRRTAQDMTGGADLYGEGWDKWTGWGRVHAKNAVDAVAPGKIPPDVNITAPDWYAPLRGDAQVRGVISARSYPVKWTLEAGGGDEPHDFRPLAGGTLRKPTKGGIGGQALGRIDPSTFEGGPGVMLRLRATDAAGNTSEDRGFVFALRDRQLREGFPKRLSASGESSPQLAQIDGKRGLEIVLATQNGDVRVLSGRTGRSLRGWPRRLGRTPHSRPTARRIGTLRPGVTGTPAVADLDGDRRKEIVVAAMDGRVHVWDRRGRRRRGFPVRIDMRRPEPKKHLDSVIYASPALGDLDRDGKLDIVVGAADQKIYAWNHRGRRLRGWPVLARDGEGGDVAKILSSPALGDIDGDRSLDVVEGTAEAYGATPSGSGRVYAFSADGKLKPGWPLKVPSLSPEVLPLAGEGVPVSPTLTDVDGDGADEVAVSAVAGESRLYRGDGSQMGDPHFAATGAGAGSDSSAPSMFNVAGNGAFGRLTEGGPLRFFAGAVDKRLGVAAAEPGTRVPFDHLRGGWDVTSGAPLSGFPRVMEGWFFANAPAIADVDGQAPREVVAGSSGGFLHAFREDGTEPEGWPKLTGGFMIASPAIGDVDGDPGSELVQITRDGWLYLWDLPAPALAPEWPVVRGNARNTGTYGR